LTPCAASLPLLVGLRVRDVVERPVDEWPVRYRELAVQHFGRHGVEVVRQAIEGIWASHTHQLRFMIESLTTLIGRCETELAADARAPEELDDESKQARLKQQQELEKARKQRTALQAIDPAKTEAYDRRIWFRTRHVVEHVWAAMRPYLHEELKGRVAEPQTDLIQQDFSDRAEVLVPKEMPLGCPGFLLNITAADFNDGNGRLAILDVDKADLVPVKMQDMAGVAYPECGMAVCAWSVVTHPLLGS
jgi:hypothetical protein